MILVDSSFDCSPRLCVSARDDFFCLASTKPPSADLRDHLVAVTGGISNFSPAEAQGRRGYHVM